MNINMFDKTISVLSKALDVMSIRHEVIASNIANQDTPNYSGKNVNFAKALDSAISSQQAGGITTTNPRHIRLNESGAGDMQGIVEVTPDRGADYDNNNVNAEIEMSKMAENTILYNASAQLIASKFKSISSAIKDSR